MNSIFFIRAPAPDIVFGVPAVRSGKEQVGARECVSGFYNLDEQEPDADLGTTIDPAWSNVTQNSRPCGKFN